MQIETVPANDNDVSKISSIKLDKEIKVAERKKKCSRREQGISAIYKKCFVDVYKIKYFIYLNVFFMLNS